VTHTGLIEKCQDPRCGRKQGKSDLLGGVDTGHKTALLFHVHLLDTYDEQEVTGRAFKITRP